MPDEGAAAPDSLLTSRRAPVATLPEPTLRQKAAERLAYSARRAGARPGAHAACSSAQKLAHTLSWLPLRPSSRLAFAGARQGEGANRAARSCVALVGALWLLALPFAQATLRFACAQADEPPLQVQSVVLKRAPCMFCGQSAVNIHASALHIAGQVRAKYWETGKNRRR